LPGQVLAACSCPLCSCFFHEWSMHMTVMETIQDWTVGKEKDQTTAGYEWCRIFTFRCLIRDRYFLIFLYLLSVLILAPSFNLLTCPPVLVAMYCRFYF
jgi:hypothetical protein